MHIKTVTKKRLLSYVVWQLSFGYQSNQTEFASRKHNLKFLLMVHKRLLKHQLLLKKHALFIISLVNEHVMPGKDPQHIFVWNNYHVNMHYKVGSLRQITYYVSNLASVDACIRHITWPVLLQKIYLDFFWSIAILAFKSQHQCKFKWNLKHLNSTLHLHNVRHFVTPLYANLIYDKLDTSRPQKWPFSLTS